jgi:AcrR family transcriptional regulator
VAGERTPDPNRRSERSRTAILTATMEILREVDYPGLTIEAIAARAGVGKQTIYRWWRSKGAVVLDAIVAATVTGQSLALPDTGDIRADLRLVIRATVAELANPGTSGNSRALTIETLTDETLGEQARDRLLGPQLDATKDRLRAGQRAGQLRDDVDLDVAVELLFGPLYHRWLLRTGPLTDDYADEVVDLALRALLAAEPGQERDRASG